MTTPIIEHIAANVATTIDGITTGAGYNQTLTARRPPRNDFKDTPPTNGLVLIKQSDTGREPDPTMSTAWKETFNLYAYVIESDSVTTSIDIKNNQVRSDIEKAILVDVTRGGYAHETEIADIAEFVDDEGFSGIAVIIEVKYRTVYGDPYTKG